ncbi:methyl-accepting chemotaxis protein [Tritonibacter mobilis]|nr:methyl-accepting chemotaxis protein [Tritonibacter mobilis]
MRLRLVMLLVIGPMMALSSYLAYDELHIQWDKYAHARLTKEKTLEESLMNNVVHEMQKERGFSAGFIASQGKNFPTELTEQRRLTDEAIADSMSRIPVIEVAKPDMTAAVRERIGQLQDMRQRVDSLGLTVPEMAKFYTSTIGLMLEMARPATEGEPAERLRLLEEARVLLASAKEAAGLERAMGATGLGKGFDLALHDRFVHLGGEQGAYLHEVDALVDLNVWLSELLSTDAYKEIAETRSTLVRGYSTGDFGGLTAGEWFQISTNWINTLREQEIEIGALIDRIATDIESSSQTAFRAFAAVTLISLLLAFSIAVYMFGRVIKRVGELTDVVKAFTRGDYSVFVQGIEGKDELSVMAHAIYSFKQETLKTLREAEALEAEQDKRKKEQDHIVGELRGAFTRLSVGDLTVEFTEPFPEDYEDVRADFNQTIGRLRESMEELVDTAGSLCTGAAEIDQAASDLSQRTESQAATLEETAAALEEMTASVKSAADGARNAERTTEEARSEATQSGTVVKDAVEAMSEIEKGSQQIAQIISVIDDIAFQTNLLALNAGVEAARAGEAGRGFAVVASEVRALALRSSDAAMEIKSLIGNSSEQVERGVDLVRHAGEALESIVGQVTHISTLVTEITKGAVEQSTGLEEINTGVVQLDQVTQQNAAMVEETTAASSILNSNARQLGEIVQRFKIRGDQAADNMPQLSRAS